MLRIFMLLLVAISSAFCQFAVNEIMYNPSGTEPAGEWFEIINISGSDANLNGWMYSDSGSAASPVVITSADIIVPAGGYAIIAHSTVPGSPTCDVIIPATWRQLNNSGYDGVKLWTPGSILVESTIYIVTEENCAEDFFCNYLNF